MVMPLPRRQAFALMYQAAQGTMLRQRFESTLPDAGPIPHAAKGIRGRQGKDQTSHGLAPAPPRQMGVELCSSMPFLHPSRA
eukprot:761378-Pelagomonas_calceolata.AAC.2